MSDPFANRPFPRGVLIAVATLLGAIILMISVARLTGMSPEQIPVTAVVTERCLRFEDLPDGTLTVYDDANGALLETLEPGDGGFIRGVLRTMARTRMLHRVADSEPFCVARREDGAVTLEDRDTDTLLRLRAFGASNEAAFAALLAATPKSQ